MGTGGRIKAVREPARARQEHLFVRMYGVWVYIVSGGSQIFSMVSVGVRKSCQYVGAAVKMHALLRTSNAFNMKKNYMRTHSICAHVRASVNTHAFLHASARDLQAERKACNFRDRYVSSKYL